MRVTATYVGDNRDESPVGSRPWSEDRRTELRLPTAVPLSWRSIRLAERRGATPGRDGRRLHRAAAAWSCRDVPTSLGLGSVVEIELRTHAGTTTRRGLVVADPGVDRRLHLALRVAAGEQDLVSLLAGGRHDRLKTGVSPCATLVAGGR